MKRTLDFLLTQFLGEILRRMDALEAQGVRLMATIEEVQGKLVAIETAIAEERTEVQGMLQGLRDQIQTLQDQIAQGANVTQEQLDVLDAQAGAIVARVQAISEPIVDGEAGPA